MTLPPSYELGLAQLGHRLQLALRGHDDERCACELEVTPLPSEGKLILAPCLPPPEPPPPPPPSGSGPTQVKRPKRLVGGFQILPGSFGTPTDCSVEHDPSTAPRAWAWCHFLALTETVEDHPFDPYNGYPLWETFQPMRSWYPSGDLKWVLDPAQQSVADKSVMVDMGARDRLFDHDYFDACAMAIRTQVCSNFEAVWTPRVKTGDRVIKNFFVRHGELPASLDESTLYSWVPPNEERRYLVGMHIAPGRIDAWGQSDAYFRWISYWVPAPPGDTLTKDGKPLGAVYSPHCPVGSGLDRPAELSGPWSKFLMCTDSANDEAACGNPWAPGECFENGTTSCTGCHASTGKLSVEPQGWGTSQQLFVGWLPSLVMNFHSHVNDCVAKSEADMLAGYSWWMTPTKPDSTEPLRCGLSSPNVVDPFAND